jgi:hypothetical protein
MRSRAGAAQLPEAGHLDGGCAPWARTSVLDTKYGMAEADALTRTSIASLDTDRMNAGAQSNINAAGRPWK